MRSGKGSTEAGRDSTDHLPQRTLDSLSVQWSRNLTAHRPLNSFRWLRIHRPHVHDQLCRLPLDQICIL